MDVETASISSASSVDQLLSRNTNLESNPMTSHHMRQRRQRLLVGAIVVLAVAMVMFVLGYITGYFYNWSPSSVTPAAPTRPPPTDPAYRFAAVAADNTECSRLGVDFLLKRGASAVDAAVATLMCMSLYNAQSAGIGGGLFMTIYNRSTGEAFTLDARETAPLKATTEMFYNQPENASIIGGLAVAVPGALHGLWQAHQRFGRLPWSELIQPSIRLAEDGFKLSQAMFVALNYSKDDLRHRSPFNVTFLDHGEPKPVGSIIKLPLLAQTFKILATEGIDAFYNGSLTDIVIREIKGAGGIIEREDLTKYQSYWHEPLHTKLVNKFVNSSLDIYSVKPPSSGAVLAYILQILNGYNMSEATDAASVLSTHRLAEAFKFAYARRMELGDMRFVDNITELVQNMTQPWYAELTRRVLDDARTHDPTYYQSEPIFAGSSAGTSHLSVLAPNGDAVSVTSTINLFFGSLVVGSETGIFYNNEMDDFSTSNRSNSFNLPPSWANRIQPGKRPLSSMCPMIGVDEKGNVRLVLGAAGGSHISSATAQVAVRVLQLNETLSSAIEEPRWHNQLYPNVLYYGPGMSQVLLDGMAAKGHNVSMEDWDNAVVQGIFVESSGIIRAHSDGRNYAQADGF